MTIPNGKPMSSILKIIGDKLCVAKTVSQTAQPGRHCQAKPKLAPIRAATAKILWNVNTAEYIWIGFKEGDKIWEKQEQL